MNLTARQLIVVTGKGGVGKTTLAAAVARRVAAAGRKVLLLEIDPRESLHQLLGTEPSGGGIVKVGPRLSAQNLQPRAVVEALVREKIPLGMLARKVIANPVFQHFADGAPGLKEMAVLGYALRTVEGDYRHKADCVVLDAPATGHGASMLAAPLLLAEAIGGGQLGEMAKDLAQFIADPERTGVVLTTLAEEMPVQEAIELIGLLEERIGRPPELVIANALYPPFPDRSSPGSRGGAAEPVKFAARSRKMSAAEGPADLATVLDLWSRRREVNDHELDRLRGHWRGSFCEIPLFPLDRGPALLDAVEAALASGLPAAPIRKRGRP